MDAQCQDPDSSSLQLSSEVSASQIISGFHLSKESILLSQREIPSARYKTEPTMQRDPFSRLLSLQYNKNGATLNKVEEQKNKSIKHKDFSGEMESDLDQLQKKIRDLETKLCLPVDIYETDISSIVPLPRAASPLKNESLQVEMFGAQHVKFKLPTVKVSKRRLFSPQVRRPLLCKVKRPISAHIFQPKATLIKHSAIMPSSARRISPLIDDGFVCQEAGQKVAELQKTVYMLKGRLKQKEGLTTENSQIKKEIEEMKRQFMDQCRRNTAQQKQIDCLLFEIQKFLGEKQALKIEFGNFKREKKKPMKLK